MRMPGTDPIKYIIKHSDGSMTKAFFEKDSGILISVFTNCDGWTNPQLFAEDTLPHFAMDVDEDGNLHILYQDCQGNLLYNVHARCNDQPSPATMLISGSYAIVYNRSLQIKCSVDGIFFFYTAKYLKNRILAFQCINDNVVSVIHIMDHISERNRSYRVSLSRDGVLQVYYASQSDTLVKLGFKEYIPEKRHFGKFQVISEAKNYFGGLSVTDDAFGNLHLSWSCAEQGNTKIMYLCQAFQSSTATVGEALVSSDSPISVFSLLLIQEKLILFWIQDNTVYFKASMDNGENWSDLKEHHCPGLQLNDLAAFFLFCRESRSYTFYPLLPANLFQKPFLAFLDSQDSLCNQEKIVDEPMDEVKDQIAAIMFSISQYDLLLEKLGENLEQAIDDIASIKDDMSQLDERLNHLDSLLCGLASSNDPLPCSECLEEEADRNTEAPIIAFLKTEKKTE